jgi:imidazolonepropionase
MIVVRHVDCLLTMDPSQGEGPLGELRDAAVAIDRGRVVFVGADADAPAGAAEIDGRGTIGLPGLVDAHTHSVWLGSRHDEFVARLGGATYAEILERGGGILSTVDAVRAGTDAALVAAAAGRLSESVDQGVVTLEIKGGYGLEAPHERRMLEAARSAGAATGARVFTTFLGAHAIPREWRHDRDGYVADVIETQLPRCAPVADFADVYVDRGAFTVDEGVRILTAAKAAGLGLRAHAEQIAHTRFAAAAARLGALSVDHLERIDDDGIAAVAAAGTVAMMLPAAMLYLRDVAPPVAKLREAGVPFAVATDRNPGSSPTSDLWACATLACLTMGLTVEEALLGITTVAARSLGRPDLGVLRPGAAGDLVLVRPPWGERAGPGALVQPMGPKRVALVLRDGAVLRRAP